MAGQQRLYLASQGVTHAATPQPIVQAIGGHLATATVSHIGLWEILLQGAGGRPTAVSLLAAWISKQSESWHSGDVTAQLVARQWLITDAHGRQEGVRGLAVVGHQPLLKPGEAFEYQSWTRLDTPHGSMRGTYFCMTEDARPFEAPVAEFQLVFPGLLH